MARFRYQGTNWEGIRWRTAPAITTLGEQITAAYPQRQPQDGTVASRIHDQVSPRSDHRPDGEGVVRAIDWGGPDLYDIAEQIRLSQDRRVRYLIHNGQMFSSYEKPGYPPYTWRPYSGSNQHATHVHVSTWAAYDNDTRQWQISEGGQELVISEGATGATVSKIQKAINGVKATFGGDPITVDGQYGPITTAEVAAYQRSADIPDTGEVDGITMALLMEFVPDWVDNHTDTSGLIVSGDVVITGTIRQSDD